MTVLAPPLSRQQARNERSTNALLDAAAELIVEGGFSALTLATIGERAGYSRGLVTARFGSKDLMVGELIERIVGRWSHRNVLPRTKGKSGREAMLVMLDAIRAQAERDPRALRVLYALMFEAIGPDDALKARFASFHEGMRTDFARFVQRGKRDGSVAKSVNANAEATLVIAGLRGIGYQWLLDPEHFDPVPALAYLHATTADRLTTDS